MEADQAAKLLLNDECKDIDLFNYLNDKYAIPTSKQMEFVIEWITSGKKAYVSYKKIYNKSYKVKHGKDMPISSARASSSRLLKTVNFELSDYLNLRGHGLDRMMDSLETLYKTDPKEYMKYSVKLHGLDIIKNEISGQIIIPPITINMYGEDNAVGDE